MANMENFPMLLSQVLQMFCEVMMDQLKKLDLKSINKVDSIIFHTLNGKIIVTPDGGYSYKDDLLFMNFKETESFNYLPSELHLMVASFDNIATPIMYSGVKFKKEDGTLCFIYKFIGKPYEQESKGIEGETDKGSV